MAGFEIVSEVTTVATDFDGRRHDAWSELSSNTAPENYVIDNQHVMIEWLSSNGSENRQEVFYDDWVEVIPGSGLKFPKTIKVRVYALSPSGKFWTGRGWSKVRFTGTYLQYKF